MKDTSSHCMLKSNDVFQSSTKGNLNDDQDAPQNHQYECIPEYILTMTRHHQPPIICHRSHQLYHQATTTCGVPYSTFSRSYLIPQGITTTTSTSDSSQCTCSPPPSITVAQEESSTPLLTPTISKESHKVGESTSPKSMMIGWTRRNPSSLIKHKSDEQQYSFLSQLRKSSIL